MNIDINNDMFSACQLATVEFFGKYGVQLHSVMKIAHSVNLGSDGSIRNQILLDVIRERRQLQNNQRLPPG